MRYPLLIVTLFCVLTCYSQTDSLLNMRLPADSLLQARTRQLDSIQYSFLQQSDSLKQRHRAMFADLDAQQQQVQHRIDSLQSLQLPTGQLTQKLDSINQKRTELTGSLQGKMDALKQKAHKQVADLQLPPELQGKAGTVTQYIDNFKLPVQDFNLPGVGIPGNPLSSLDGLNATIPSPAGTVGSVEGLGNLTGLPDELGALTSVSKQAGAYQQDIQQLAQGNLGDMNALPETLESKAAEAAGVGDLQGHTKALDPLMDAAKSPDAMKAQAVEKVQQEAVNHFAGKEEVLQQAMDKMSKLKQKYASLNSLSEIPKKRPNAMRGKPLVERLLPGIAMQIQKKGNDLLVDFNPYVGYRFSGRLTAGGGWNQRVSYNTRYDQFTKTNRIFGPRLYGEFMLGKGFAPRAEAELMNTFIPTRFQPGITDAGRREWVPGVFVGLKKEYRFVKSVKGTALVMLRVFNPDHKSPYADVLNMRFGFEFPLRKRPAKQKEAPPAETEK